LRTEIVVPARYAEIATTATAYMFCTRAPMGTQPVINSAIPSTINFRTLSPGH